MRSPIVYCRFNLKRSVGQREECPSRCSVIHPVGDHNHRNYFLQNQKPVIRMEWSTDFFRFKKRGWWPLWWRCWGLYQVVTVFRFL
ncbi:MAG: hypothetical protein P8179_18965 [Candidatus Thiodiazotropha sp.]